MSCNHDCNQGRRCDCVSKEVQTKDLIYAGIVGTMIGVVLAVTYVIKTGGF